MVIILKIELKNTIKTIFISLNPYTNEKKTTVGEISI